MSRPGLRGRSRWGGGLPLAGTSVSWVARAWSAGELALVGGRMCPAPQVGTLVSVSAEIRPDCAGAAGGAEAGAGLPPVPPEPEQ